MQQIGGVVKDSLVYAGVLEGTTSEFRVHADTQDDGTVYCWIAGGTQRDQSVFVRSLREVLRPMEDPRYLLARSGWWRLIGEDYFSVPNSIARKREGAEYFARQWNSKVGPVQLVYTRAPEGRKILLRARLHSLAVAFEGQSEGMSCWK
jgi:hypothetical protein